MIQFFILSKPQVEQPGEDDVEIKVEQSHEKKDGKNDKEK